MRSKPSYAELGYATQADMDADEAEMAPVIEAIAQWHLHGTKPDPDIARRFPEMYQVLGLDELPGYDA